MSSESSAATTTKATTNTVKMKPVVGVVRCELMQAIFEPILKQVTQANSRSLPSNRVRFHPTKEFDNNTLWKLQSRATFELQSLHMDEDHVIATWKTDKELLECLGSPPPTTEVAHVKDASVLDLSLVKHAVLSLEGMEVDYWRLRPTNVSVIMPGFDEEKVLSGIAAQLSLTNSFEGPGAFPAFYGCDAEKRKKRTEMRVSNVFKRGTHIVVEWETREGWKGECIAYTVLPSAPEIDFTKFSSDWIPESR